MREFPDTVGERAVRRCAGGFFDGVCRDVGQRRCGGWTTARGRRDRGGVERAAGEIVYYRMLPEAVSRKSGWGDEMKKPPSSGGFEFWAKWLRARSRAAGWRF